MADIVALAGRSHRPEQGTERSHRPEHLTAAASPAARAPAQVSGLAALRAAGLVRRASEEQPAAVARTLPVAAGLTDLFPGGGLRRGSTVAVRSTSDSPGASSLLLTLVATASASGSWCAAVGLPALGMVAAAEAGVAVERFALVPRPGPDWATVVAALLDGLDIVVVATPGPVPAVVRTRLAARARQRGSVLVPFGRWEGADLTLTTAGATWSGLEWGRGRLRRCDLTVEASGRGAAARSRRTTLTLPAGTAVEPVPLRPVPTHRPDEIELAG